MWNQSSKTKTKANFNSAQEAYDCALKLLTYRDYSEQKLRERLQRKGADAEQSDAAVEKLQHYGLIDDRRYAQRVYEYWLQKGAYGRLHLQAELQKRGVAPELVRETVAQFTSAQEEVHAEKAAAVFLQRNGRKLEQLRQDKRKLYAAAGRFMAARGFSGEHVKILWEKLLSDTDI